MPAHFGTAARAARTASRTSLRDARATFWPSASYVRPDSERGNAPPMNSLYVFLTGRRDMASGYGRGQIECHQHVVDVPAVEEEFPALDALDDEAGRLVQADGSVVVREH